MEQVLCVKLASETQLGLELAQAPKLFWGEELMLMLAVLCLNSVP